MCGYDVAIDKGLTKEETLNLGSTLGLLYRASGNFKLSEKLWFTALLQYQSISFKNKTLPQSYQLTDATGSYNVMLNNVSTFKTGAISLGIGIKFTIK